MNDHTTPPAPEPAPTPAPPLPVPPAPRPPVEPPAYRVLVKSDPQSLAAEQELARNSAAQGRVADAHAELLALERDPKLPHEVWLAAFVARTAGTRAVATNAAYADEAVKLYNARFKPT